MVLSDVDIKRYIAQGKIKIAPELPPEQFGSCSVDFRLGGEFNIFEHSRHPFIDLKEKKGIDGLMKSVEVPPGDSFILQPREFVLAITEESLELDDDVRRRRIPGRETFLIGGDMHLARKRRRRRWVQDCRVDFVGVWRDGHARQIEESFEGVPGRKRRARRQKKL